MPSSTVPPKVMRNSVAAARPFTILNTVSLFSSKNINIFPPIILKMKFLIASTIPPLGTSFESPPELVPIFLPFSNLFSFSPLLSFSSSFFLLDKLVFSSFTDLPSNFFISITSELIFCKVSPPVPVDLGLAVDTRSEVKLDCLDSILEAGINAVLGVIVIALLCLPFLLEPRGPIPFFPPPPPIAFAAAPLTAPLTNPPPTALAIEPPINGNIMSHLLMYSYGRILLLIEHVDLMILLGNLVLH